MSVSQAQDFRDNDDVDAIVVVSVDGDGNGDVKVNDDVQVDVWSLTDRH